MNWLPCGLESRALPEIAGPVASAKRCERASPKRDEVRACRMGGWGKGNALPPYSSMCRVVALAGPAAWAAKQLSARASSRPQSHRQNRQKIR